MVRKFKRSHRDVENSRRFEIYFYMDSKLENYSKISLSAYAIIAPVFATIYAYTYATLNIYIVLTVFVVIMALLNFFILLIIMRLQYTKYAIDVILSDLSVDSATNFSSGPNLYELLYFENKTSVDVVCISYFITVVLGIMCSLGIQDVIRKWDVLGTLTKSIDAINMAAILCNFILFLLGCLLLRGILWRNKDLKKSTEEFKKNKAKKRRIYI